jgi:hypothetical protein
MTKGERTSTPGCGSRFRFPPKGGEPPEPDNHRSSLAVPGTTWEPDGNHTGAAALLPVLAYLEAHPAGAIVATLAAELGASAYLVERRLYSLRRQGLVTSEWLGTPAVLTWKAAP